MELKPCITCGKMIQSDGTEMCCSCYSKWKETLPEENAALRSRIAELEYQLANYKASADGTTHWCAECKMRDDRIAELEKQAIVWHKYPDEKPSMDTCPVHSHLFGSMFNDISFISLILYVDNVHNNIQGAWVYNVKNDSFESDEGFSLDGKSVLAWAYLPEPPRDVTNDES